MELIQRHRRARSHAFSRKLMQETTLATQDLIYPIFVHEASNNQLIKTMPGIERHSINSLINQADLAVSLGISAVALFPSIEASFKSADAKEAFNPKGLIPNAIKKLKQKHPSLGIIADVALDPYTSHGHDGLINSSGEIMNDETVAALVKQSLVLAEAGADILAPSDMMDGRIGSIRQNLEKNGFKNCIILSYAAKYASNLYSPFRHAISSKTSSKVEPNLDLKLNLKSVNKSSYQMDFHNSAEALSEVQLDLIEGADWLLIKPGMMYLDILFRVKQHFNKPTFSYQVSGEFSMLKFASEAKAIDYEKCLIESLVCLKRAGADGILTYGAIEAARILANK